MNQNELFPGMASHSKSEEKKEGAQKELFSKDIVRQSRVMERVLEAEYGFLPVSHPVTKYVQRCFDDVFPKEGLQARVTIGGGEEPNALSLPHGVVVVTRGMLKLLDTEDELKIVGGHEGIHYREGHVEEINEAIKYARKKLETKKEADVALSTVKVFGIKRFAEYEADIRGVMAATEGKANPSAARSLFLKLDAHAKGRKRQSDITHGQNIDRIINLGIVGQLTDFQSSTLPEKPLPNFVTEFAKAGADTTLLDLFKKGKLTERVQEEIKEATLGTLLFSLRELNRSVEEDESHDQNEASTVQEILEPRYVGHEKYPQIFLAGMHELHARLKKTFPKTDERKRNVLTHALLEMAVGLRTDETSDGPIGKFMCSFDDIDSVAQAMSDISILRPDVFEKLGVVFADPSDVRIYGDLVLRSMNESSIFASEDGSFDDAGYLATAGSLASRLQEIFLKTGLGNNEDVSLVTSVMREGLLNLNLRKGDAPVFDFVKKLQVSWKGEGLKPHPDEVLSEIQDQKRLQLTNDRQQELVDILLKDSRFFPVLHALQADKDVRLAFSGVDESDVFTDIFLSQIGQKGIENEAEKKLIHRKQSLERAYPAALKLFNQAGCRTLKELESLLIEVFELGTQFTNALTGATLPKADADEEDVLPPLAPEKLSIIDRMQDADGETENSITAACDTFAACAIRGLIEESAEFLPKTKTERAQVLFALMFSSSESEVRQLAYFFLRGYIDGQFLSPKEREGLPNVQNAIETLHILSGDHQVYAAYGIVPAKFSPSKTNVVGDLFADNEFMAISLFQCFQSLLRAVQSGKIVNKKELAECVSMIVRWALRYVDDVTWLEAFRGQEHEDEEFHLIKNFLDVVFEKFQFDLDDSLDQELLLQCSGLSSDLVLRARLQDEILRRRGEKNDFNAQLQLLFREPLTRFSMTKDLKEEFVEKRAQTFEEIKQVADALLENVDVLADPEYMGATVMLQELTGFFTDKWELFEMMLELGKTDRRWKEALFHQARKGGTDEEAIIRTDQWLNQLAHTNDLVKYVILRDVLVGKKGLLLGVESRKKLLDYLFKKHLRVESREQAKLLAIIEEIKDVMVEIAEPDLLFFAIAPLLHEQILRAPKKIYSWEKMLLQFYGRREIARSTLARSEKLRRGEGVQVEHAGEMIDIKPVPASAYLDKLNKLLRPSAETRPEDGEINWSVDEFVLKVAQNLGSPGTRFLQILGQYVDLPEALYEKFKEVYDNVKSQSKITACHTLQREWPACEKELEAIEERVGGGSLMSAYRVRRRSDRKRGRQVGYELVKILSPNAELQLNMSIQFINRVLEVLVGKNRARYEPAQTAMRDIERWIREDIHYSDFLEKDKIFKARYEGFALPDGRYKIHIPDSYGVGKLEQDNLYVKREEFVQGVTFNRLESGASGHNHKEIVALIVRNFIQQIIDGQVHSNIHPGNLMISTDTNGQDHVAIIDRNYYIELRPQDQRLIQALSQAEGSFDDMMREVIHYLDQSGGEARVDETVAQRIKQTCLKAWEEAPNFVSRLSRVLLVLKKEGLKIPLFVTLLANNVISLNAMAKRAGFESLQEAMAYSP